MLRKILFVVLLILIASIAWKQDPNAKIWKNTKVPAESIRVAIDRGEDVIIDNCKIFRPLIKEGTWEKPDTIQGRLLIHRSCFYDEVTFNHCHFVQRLDLLLDCFVEEVSFDHTNFGGGASFTGAGFYRGASFRRTTFDSKVSFGVYGYADLPGRFLYKGEHDFIEPVVFDDHNHPFRCATTFGDKADFTDATFAGSAYFDRATFGGDASFRDATFAGLACFDSATFDTGAYFSDVTFSDEVDFAHSTFGGVASFQGSIFDTTVIFSFAKFDTIVYFSPTPIVYYRWFEPDSIIGYRATSFGEYADFRQATFDGDAHFGDATFDTVSFLDARFVRQVDLSRMRFKEILIFWKQLEGHLICDTRTSYELKKQFEEKRMLDDADGIYLYMKDQERMKKSPWVRYPEYWFIQLTCGYRVKPLNTLYLSIGIILVFMLFYTKSNAIKEIEKEFGRRRRRTIRRNLRRNLRKRLYDAIYFSVQTFIIGVVPDWHPTDEFLIKFWKIKLFKFRTFAMIEGALGWVLLVLFVVTLTRKFIR